MQPHQAAPQGNSASESSVRCYRCVTGTAAAAGSLLPLFRFEGQLSMLTNRKRKERRRKEKRREIHMKI